METQFANLKLFYQNQLAHPDSTDTGLAGLGDLGFSSPTSLSRIMSLYTGGGLQDKKAKSRVGAMREALEPDEGFQLANLDESAAIAQLQAESLDETASASQLADQPPNIGEEHLHGRSRFASELRPIPYLLRTKRSKRCPICRHIISKPEAKVQTTRFPHPPRRGELHPEHRDPPARHLERQLRVGPGRPGRAPRAAQAGPLPAHLQEPHLRAHQGDARRAVQDPGALRQ